jgi:hypothetical protein
MKITLKKQLLPQYQTDSKTIPLTLKFILKIKKIYTYLTTIQTMINNTYSIKKR